MINVLRLVGAGAITLNNNIGKLALFIIEVFASILRPPIYWREFFKQILEIGYYSLPVVGLTAIFTGCVLALQSYTGFSRMNAESAIASVVVLSITRELGPVLAGLMLAGRVGAAITAEIGTMKVTEQIDALYTLNTNPISYLVVPRILAAVIMMPCLVLIADTIGVFGGYLISIHKLGFSPEFYLRKTLQFLRFQDVFSGLIKAAVFGFIVATMGCYHGYYSKGGAEGVGRSTMSAVVTASIFVLLFNYVITGLLFIK